MATEVLMPRQGQSVESCVITEWRVTEGDAVVAGQPICDIETDKAAFEVEAPVSGTVLGIFFPEEADVEVLRVIAAIGEPGEDISALRPEDMDSNGEELLEIGKAERAEISRQEEAIDTQTRLSSPGASPRAKNLAKESGVDITGIPGTGPRGRVIERDVVETQPATASSAATRTNASAEGLKGPEVGSGTGGRVRGSDQAAVAPGSPGTVSESMGFPGNTTEIPVKGVRKLVAERMHASLRNSAQLTHHASADARAVLAFRQECKANPKEDSAGAISINDIVLYVTVRTLAEFPGLNAHWQGESIVQFENVHLGLAVDTTRGLMVPVIRYANLMSLEELSAEARRLAAACTEGNVNPDLLGGGTFTVTNLGSLGIEAFTPVLNTPEVGILGVCAIQPKPVMSDQEVGFVPHLGLSLTFDHRAVDGAPAARFLSALGARLSAFRQASVS